MTSIYKSRVSISVFPRTLPLTYITDLAKYRQLCSLQIFKLPCFRNIQFCHNYILSNFEIPLVGITYFSSLPVRKLKMIESHWFKTLSMRQGQGLELYLCSNFVAPVEIILIGRGSNSKIMVTTKSILFEFESHSIKTSCVSLNYN